MAKDINLNGIPQEEKSIYLCYIDLIAFGKTFLSGDFLKTSTPLFHYEVADQINRNSNKPCAIILPRDSAKTTIIKASIIKDFSYSKAAMKRFSAWSTTRELQEFWAREAEERKPYFYAWIAKSQDDSKDNIRYISIHLTRNQKLLHYFSQGLQFRGRIWNTENLITINGDRLLSSSNLKSVRGKTELAEESLDSGSQRLTRVFADDFENETNTKTLSARNALKNLLLAGVLPAISTTDKRACLFVVGTPVHQDSFIQNCIDAYNKNNRLETNGNVSWRIIMYKSTQPNMEGGVLWHSYRPRKKLDEIKQKYLFLGKPSLYYQEYELEVQNESASKWTRDSINYHNGSFVTIDNKNFLIINGKKILVNTFIGCDPATDIDKVTSDFSVIMAIAVDSANRRYVLEYERHRGIPTVAQRDSEGNIIGKHGVVDYMINMYIKYNCCGGAVEDVAMNRSVLQALSDRKRILNRFDINIAPKEPGGVNKHNRIYSFLSSMFASGLVYYRENMYDLIEETIMLGPLMAHDDTIETFYYANVYARPPILKNKPKEIPGINNPLSRNYISRSSFKTREEDLWMIL